MRMSKKFNLIHYEIFPASKLSGSVTPPASKSHSLRAILLASLTEGSNYLYNILASPDTDAMIKACLLLGADILPNKEKNSLIITGTGGIDKCNIPDDVINAGNSGQVLRFVAGICSLLSAYTVFTGDFSIRYRRPMQTLLDSLQQLGAAAFSTKKDGYAPLVVGGPWSKNQVEIEGSDSQPVSALLIASAFSSQNISIQVNNPAEKPWLDLTCFWLDKLGVDYEREEYQHFFIKGKNTYPAFDMQISTDFSSAAFLIAAAIITRSTLTLNNMDMNDIQGDKAFILILKNLGIHIEENSALKTLTIYGEKSQLHGGTIDVNDIIDAVPILAVLGCFAREKILLKNAEIARHKESDRLSAISCELIKMGAKIEVMQDGLAIHPCHLRGAVVESHDDHRIAMALSIAALGASGKSLIENCQCVEKSYSGFVDDLVKVGAKIQVFNQVGSTTAASANEKNEKLPINLHTLIGFKGVGKSTIGAILASKLSANFFDTDEVILEILRLEEKKFGNISEAYQALGESKFRSYEYEALQKIINYASDAENTTILATGGGIVTHSDSYNLLATLTSLIHLEVPSSILWQRYQLAAKNFKSNKFKDEKYFLKIYAERFKAYQQLATLNLQVMDEPAEKTALILFNLLPTSILNFGN